MNALIRENEIKTNYLIKISKAFQKYIEKDKTNGIKTILIPITRKGYWMFELFLENIPKKISNNYEDEELLSREEVLQRFEIYSDRYLTKVLDPDEFKNKRVVLFDDLVVTGDHLFFYYALLKKWGATVEIITMYRELFSGKQDKRFGDKEKIAYYKEIFGENHIGYDELKNNFWKALDVNIELTTLLIQEDVAKESANEIMVLGKNLCPMTIDLPLMVGTGDLNEQEGFLKRSIIIDQQNWDRIKENSEWQFVENIVEETPEVEINASFFEAAKCMKQLSSWGQVENCIIKCKYKEEIVDGEQKIHAIFIPFVIMKSMNYFELIELFEKLFKGTLYGNQIAGNETAYLPKLFGKIGKNINLYRAMYRAVVLYFSMYIGLRFKDFLIPYVKGTITIDQNFMKEHLPEELINTLQKFESEEKIEDNIQSMGERLFISSEENFQIKFYNSGEKEIDYDIWQQIYFYVKRKLIEIKFGRNIKDSVLTIEKMEADIEDMIPEMESMERRIAIAKAITLFQESGCFSNFLINNKEKGIIQRGFKPGKNVTKFLGKEVLSFVPYVYALYLKVGEEHFYEHYDQLIQKMKVYFYENNYFEYKISWYAFDYYESFFENDTENGWGIDEKISEIRYVIEAYLEGEDQDYDLIFELVYEWEL